MPKNSQSRCIKEPKKCVIQCWADWTRLLCGPCRSSPATANNHVADVSKQNHMPTEGTTPMRVWRKPPKAP